MVAIEIHGEFKGIIIGVLNNRYVNFSIDFAFISNFYLPHTPFDHPSHSLIY